jgi:hypothetical protein
MATKLGRKLAALKPEAVRNPVLARLVGELKGALTACSGGFNDCGREHTDYIDNDRAAHTDLSEASLPRNCEPDPAHSDLSYADGRRYSHSDETDMCDNHSDSDPNHLWRWGYSDMTR